MTAHRGACLCGAVRYTVAPPYRWFAHCHCSMCRKQHGALFHTGLGVASTSLQWLAGEADVVHYRATAAFDRPFCKHCGSKVPAASHLPDVLDVPAGNLEGDFGARPEQHMFVASKSPSDHITDGLPQFDTYPSGTRLPTVERPAHPPAAAVTHGSCLCGVVAYEIDGALNGCLHCHCSRCRRSRGTAFATNGLTTPERFRFTRGAERLTRYRLPGARRYGTQFCTACGSLLPRPIPGLGVVVPIGTIDSDVEIPALAHIFVGSKAVWHEITDSLPQHLQAPPAEVARQMIG
jgi:hypothetical protein